MGGNEGASPMTNVGSADALLYYRVGPSQQVGGSDRDWETQTVQKKVATV